MTLQLSLAADNPSDQGYVSIYVLPDSNLIIHGSDGDFSSLTPTAIISDSSMVATDSVKAPGGSWAPAKLITLYINSANVAAAGTGEYWVVVALSGNSSAEWFGGPTVTGPGTAGQWYGNNNGGWGIADPAEASGQYGLICSCPRAHDYSCLCGWLGWYGFRPPSSARLMLSRFP